MSTDREQLGEALDSIEAWANAIHGLVGEDAVARGLVASSVAVAIRQLTESIQLAGVQVWRMCRAAPRGESEPAP